MGSPAAGAWRLGLTLGWRVRAALREEAEDAPYADRLASLLPAAPLSSRSQVPTRYGERNGGYCRVQAVVQPRRGDNTEMATIELV